MADVEAIATKRLEADSSSIQIDLIPTTYRHLQVRCSLIGNRADYASDTLVLRFATNGGSIDTSSNYSDQAMIGHWGNGESCFATGLGNTLDMYRIGAYSRGYYPMGVLVWDIIDYSATTKNKSLVGVGGVSGQYSSHSNDRIIGMSGGCYNASGSGSAITSLQVYPTDGNLLLRGSVLSVYGWKDNS
jgi:hypothetical protein